MFHFVQNLTKNFAAETQHSAEKKVLGCLLAIGKGNLVTEDIVIIITNTSQKIDVHDFTTTWKQTIVEAQHFTG